MTQNTIHPEDAEKTGKPHAPAVQLQASANPIRHRLTTEELAPLLRVKPQTIRAGLCNSGHYVGLRPAVKLANRRLLWDAEQVAAVING